MKQMTQMNTDEKTQMKKIMKKIKKTQMKKIISRVKIKMNTQIKLKTDRNYYQQMFELAPPPLTEYLLVYILSLVLY